MAAHDLLLTCAGEWWRHEEPTAVVQDLEQIAIITNPFTTNIEHFPLRYLQQVVGIPPQLPAPLFVLQQSCHEWDS